MSKFWFRKEIDPTPYEYSRLMFDLRTKFNLIEIDEIVLLVTSYGDFHIKRIANNDNNPVFEVKKVIYNKDLFQKPKPVFIILDEIDSYPANSPKSLPKAPNKRAFHFPKLEDFSKWEGAK